MQQSVTGCMIAGGKSRRMGKDKRFLELGGVSLIDRSLRILEGLFQDVILVLAEPVPRLSSGRHRVTYDAIKNCGSLGGLYTALIEAPSPRIFAVACDMPFLNGDLIRYLVQVDPEADIVAAKLHSGFQPLHAVYSKRCAPFLEEMARSGDLKIQGLFEHPRLNITVVGEPDLIRWDPDLRSFQNINTPGEYEMAQNLLGNARGQ
jgi:molybdopterin-guanine dinucleotide biosynthesis protein A